MTVKELIEKLMPYIENINDIQYEPGRDDVVQDHGIIIIQSDDVLEFQTDEDIEDSGDD